MIDVKGKHPEERGWTYPPGARLEVVGGDEKAPCPANERLDKLRKLR
jgi:hypothetical protein